MSERYASFMLRFQWAKNDKQPTWLISMQSTKTGQLRWFPNLEALIAFLREEFAEREGESDWRADSIKEGQHREPGGPE